MTMELSGRTAFVTGSGRGLGRFMAERLAELGADVAIHDISWTAPAKYGEFADLDAVAAQIGRHGGRVAAVSGNIGDRYAVAAMKRDIEAKLGPVHILVNCAGGDIGAAGGKPNPNNALDVSFEDIKVLTDNNLIGTMLVCQAFVPAMKAAVVHYTRCLAKELLEDGVRVNAVSPGPTKTARFQATRVVDPKRMDANAKSFNRYAEPEEIAEAVAFLAGPRAKFINGQVLRVDGGLSLFA